MYQYVGVKQKIAQYYVTEPVALQGVWGCFQRWAFKLTITKDWLKRKYFVLY